MKNRIQLTLLIMGISLFMCSFATAASTFGPVGEGEGMQTCADNEGAWQLTCAGDYCSTLASECDANYPFTTDTITTASFSEEEGTMTCPNGYAVNGYSLDGWDGYGDNITLSCVKIEGHITKDCSWGNWISDEPENLESAPDGGNWSGAPGFNNLVFCALSSQYIAGMECNGPWCDNMRIQCCDYEEGEIPEPLGIDLGPEHTETFYTAEGIQFLNITAENLVFDWTPTQINLGFSTTDNQDLSGISVWVNGGVYFLEWWWDVVEIDMTAGPVQITVEGAADRDLRTTWWVD